MRSLDELVNRDEPCITHIREWAGRADSNGGVLLAPDRAVADASLLRLQVTTRSPLGAIVYETGGILVADGLLRLLGSGPQRSLIESNRRAGWLDIDHYPGAVLIADDALGGLFAINGGAFGSETIGEVFHLAADTIDWITLGIGHTDFVEWCLLGDINEFYEPFAALDAFKQRPWPPITQVYSFYPPLWTREARDRVDVRAISADESLTLRVNLPSLLSE